jgi:GTP pyrophosphokinase
MLLDDEPERRLDIDWQEMEGERFTVRLALEATDHRTLYADIASAVSGTGTDIRSFELRSRDARATGAIEVEVENLPHLQRILRAIRRVKGVTEVSRRERIDLGDGG